MIRLLRTLSVVATEYRVESSKLSYCFAGYAVVGELNKEMTPMNILAAISWLVITKLAGNEAHQQSLKLMTRPADGAALCAMDPPTVNAAMSPRMPGAPESVRCAMTCTDDAGCKHFNYVSTESSPCQLYHYRPNTFDVSPNCQHYYEPGK